MDTKRDEDRTGTTPAAGQQHGSSTGAGGTVGSPGAREKGSGHPRPDTPGSRVEDQADQPGAGNTGSHP